MNKFEELGGRARGRASANLHYYLKMALENAGVSVDSDMGSEIRDIVDMVVEGVQAPLLAQLEMIRGGMPRVVTDPECDQWYQRWGENVFKYHELRDGESFESVIDLDDFSREQMEKACKPFGYGPARVAAMATSFEYRFLIAECIFENMQG